MNSNLGKQKFFIIYRITNPVNGKIYVGAHITYNANDKYMGSSKYLKKDMKELGRHNFKKEILHIFDNEKDMKDKEAEIVSKEFCHRDDTYNLMVGGITEFSWVNTLTVKDKDGNYSRVYIDDPRYLSGELVPNSKDLVMAIDKTGKIIRVDRDDPKYLSGELKPQMKGVAVVRGKNGKGFYVSVDDPRRLSGELVGMRSGIYQEQLNWTGKKHKQESKDKIGKANSIHQQGKNNSCYGMCWITKEGLNKKIKKEDLQEYLHNSWVRGRKC